MMHDAVITSATSGMGSIILTSSGSPKQRGHHRITVYMYKHVSNALPTGHRRCPSWYDVCDVCATLTETDDGAL